MEKVIRDNKVAVITANSYGAGWFEVNNYNQKLLFSPEIVDMIEQGKHFEITTEWVKNNLCIDNVHCHSAEDLRIQWLDIGTKFIIDEYDGLETIVKLEDNVLIA